MPTQNSTQDSGQESGQSLQAVLDTTLARQIVDDGIRRYIQTRRDRIDGFVERHFSVQGSWALNKHGFGMDVIKAQIGRAHV